MWNLEKWYRWTYFQGRNREAEREQTCRYRGKGRVGWVGRFTGKHYHVSDSGELLHSTGTSAQSSVMTQGDRLRWLGRDVQEGVRVCVYTRLTQATVQQKHNTLKQFMLLFSCPAVSNSLRPHGLQQLYSDLKNHLLHTFSLCLRGYNLNVSCPFPSPSPRL